MFSLATLICSLSAVIIASSLSSNVEELYSNLLIVPAILSFASIIPDSDSSNLSLILDIDLFIDSAIAARNTPNFLSLTLTESSLPPNISSGLAVAVTGDFGDADFVFLYCCSSLLANC